MQFLFALVRYLSFVSQDHTFFIYILMIRVLIVSFRLKMAPASPTMSDKLTTLLIIQMVVINTVCGLPQNYDDIDMSIDQPKNKKVDIR